MKIYREAFRINKDGGGFAFIENGNIVVEKGFCKFENFYGAIKEREHMALLIHCRIASHGPVNEENCHPFVFKPENSPYQFVMAHNGMLEWRSTQKFSDTHCFCEDALWPTLEKYPDFLETPIGLLFLQRTIGSRNKMVIIRFEKETNTFSTYYINKDSGNMFAGCWFSNWSWKSYEPYAKGFMGGMGGVGYGYSDYELEHEGERWRETVNGGRSQQHFPQEAGENGCYGWEKNTHGVWVNKEEGKAVINNEKVEMGKELLDEIEPKGRKVIPFINPNKPEEEPDEDRGGLKHLSKEEKKTIRRQAADFLKADKVDMKGRTDLEKIGLLRTAMRSMYPAMQVLADEALDKQIIKLDMDVVTTVIKQQEDDKKQEDIELLRAQQEST